MILVAVASTTMPRTRAGDARGQEKMRNTNAKSPNVSRILYVVAEINAKQRVAKRLRDVTGNYRVLRKFQR